ncbi:MAG: hypothetical protein KKG59_00155 [Nanoarchaeota archaeon]|nr:hypothetical protein [Nanoarchaeota archaeon]
MIEKTTVHRASVIVQNGQVVQAIIDNEWNELKQREAADYDDLNLDKSDKIPLFYCPNPRPTECAKESDPVCSNNKADFNNPCEACKKKTTKWYIKGSCALGFIDKASNDLQNGKITTESGSALILAVWAQNG